MNKSLSSFSRLIVWTLKGGKYLQILSFQGTTMLLILYKVKYKWSNFQHINQNQQYRYGKIKRVYFCYSKNQTSDFQVTFFHRQLQEDQKFAFNMLSNKSLQLIINNQSKTFTFDSVANQNSSQIDFFQNVGRPVVEKCVEGYNCCIFAYGQTGTGKTHTILGQLQDEKNKGLLPRSLQLIFQKIQQETSSLYSSSIIKCSYLQIYNQQIFDLVIIFQQLSSQQKTNLQIRQDIKKGTYVQNLIQQVVSNTQQALDLLQKGSENRHIGQTAYNFQSSRSHSVFTVIIESKVSKNGIQTLKSRKFNFVDLAGSQRSKQANTIGQRLKQGCNINKSLHILGNVINSLAENNQGKNKYIHYRDSKLTFLLKDSLGGNSKTHIIVNLSPSINSINQSHSTLKFAKNVKLIKIKKAIINQQTSGNLEYLKNQIKRLKQQLYNYKSREDCFLGKQGELLQRDNINILKQQVILKEYINQSIQIYTNLKKQINQKQQIIDLLKKSFGKFHNNEINYRMIINLYKQKLVRSSEKIQLSSSQLQDKNILIQINKMLSETPYMMSLLSENLELRQKQKNTNQTLKLLNKNLNLLTIIKEQINDNFNKIQQISRNEQYSNKKNNVEITFEQVQKINKFTQTNFLIQQNNQNVQLKNINQQLQTRIQELEIIQKQLNQKIYLQQINYKSLQNKYEQLINKVNDLDEQLVRKEQQKKIDFQKIQNLQNLIQNFNNKNKELSIIHRSQYQMKIEKLKQQKLHFIEIIQMFRKLLKNNKCQNCQKYQQLINQLSLVFKIDQKKNIIQFKKNLLKNLYQLIKLHKQTSINIKVKQSQIKELKYKFKQSQKQNQHLKEKILLKTNEKQKKSSKDQLTPTKMYQLLIALLQNHYVKLIIQKNQEYY